MPSLAIAQAMLVTCWELNWLRTAGTIARWVSTSISLLFVVRSVASAHTNGTRRSGADPRWMHPLPRSHKPFLPLGIVPALVCMGLVARWCRGRGLFPPLGVVGRARWANRGGVESFKRA